MLIAIDVKTYGQALNYLDATADFPDEAMISLFTVKVGSNSTKCEPSPY